MSRVRVTHDAGTRFGKWKLTGASRTGDRGKVFWEAVCDCENVRWVKGATLRRGTSRSCGRCTVPDGLPVTYSAVHSRLTAERGRATEHVCGLCGEEQAEQWAYRHSDPFQLSGRNGAKGRERSYSLDLSAYAPACLSCHATFDRRMSALRKGKIKPMTVADLYAMLLGKLPPLDRAPDQ